MFSKVRSKINVVIILLFIAMLISGYLFYQQKQEQTQFFCGVQDNDTALQHQNISDGKALFNTNCASCHKIDQMLTGPPLQGISENWQDMKLLRLYLRDSKTARKKSEYIQQLWIKFGKIDSHNFKDLSDDEIDAILLHLRNWKRRF